MTQRTDGLVTRPPKQSARAFAVTPTEPSDSSPFFARVILDCPWSAQVDAARFVLGEVASSWPRSHQAKVIITPGGFLTFSWPAGVSRAKVGEVAKPDRAVIDQLYTAGERAIGRLLAGDLCQQLRGCADYLTLGVDSYDDAGLEVELVYLVDLHNGKVVHRTGKSYPTDKQPTRLVRLPLKSHVAKLGKQKLLLLGCHDLFLFSPRSKATARGWRARMIREAAALVRDGRPDIVIHHPHSTGWSSVWTPCWNLLKELLPADAAFAGAWCYEGCRGKGDQNLKSALRATASGTFVDFIVRARSVG